MLFDFIFIVEGYYLLHSLHALFDLWYADRPHGLFQKLAIFRHQWVNS